MEFNGTPEEWDALVKRNKMRQEKWDNLHKELDDALDSEFGSEEPKQETLTYTEAAKKEERIFNSTMMSKQETLEEAAERLIFKTIGSKYGLSSIDEHDQVDGYFDTYLEAFLTLKLKWQSQRIYNE